MIHTGRFVVISEITAPRAPDPEYVRQRADSLAGCVDAVNVTDNQGANVHLAPWAVSILVLERGGEPILAYTTRDRNRLAIQSDLIGASALGIKNAFVISGDPISYGRHQAAHAVCDIDPIDVLRIVKTMGKPGILDSGDELRNSPGESVHPARFFIGAAENPLVGSPVDALQRPPRKVEAGADFIQTQCLFDLETFKTFMVRARARGLHEQTAVIAGVLLPRSLKTLEFVSMHLPGVGVPRLFFERMQQAEDRNRALEEGIQIAVELIHQCREIGGVRGIHLITMGHEELCRPTLEKAGLLPRPGLDSLP